MNIVIVGGGKVGYYLVKTLLPNGHNITLVEQLEESCKKIADELEVSVVHGDGTDIDILSDIGVEDADVFIAVSGQDEDNLIACQLAKRNFNVRRTIARVNNPKNTEVFEKLGVDMVMSSTALFAEMIEQELDYAGVRTLLKLQKGNLVFSELTVAKGSAGCNKKVKDLELPNECVLVSVVRGDASYVPNGHTVIRENDTIFTLCQAVSQKALFEYFGRE